MINLRKPAYGALLGFVVVVAAACGGSSATPAASTAAGASNAPAASGAPAANSGEALLAQALSGSSSVKSFHVKLTVGGTIKAAALAAADSSSSSAPATDLKLDGTNLEGDVDLAKSAAHLSFALPALPKLGGMAITADVIMVDKTLYLKTALLGGAKYMKLPLSDVSSLAGGLPLPSDLPVAVPSAGAGLSDMTSQIAALQKQLQDAGAKAEIVGTEAIGGQDATHVKITVPVDWVNQQIAKAEAAATPAADATPDPLAGAKLDSAGVDLWVYKANNQLAQLHVTGASALIGNLDLMLTLTNYDKAVSIAAPAASDVTDASGLFGANP